ncbi:hypothetical protein LINPERPRIM_LOCUS33664, partial [Linum perenne]
MPLDIPREIMDTLPKVQENLDLTKMAAEGSDSHNRLSLAQKLNGWKIELKRRTSNVDTYDAYFYHQDTNVKFRSTNEAIKFILYNEVPKNPKEVPPTKRKRPHYLVEPSTTTKERNKTQEKKNVIDGVKV